MSEIIVARDLSLGYGKKTAAVVEDVNLSVSAGEKIAIVGESGSGKSTLAKSLTGVMKPRSGTVEIHGRPWTAVRRTDPERRSVQMIFQDPYTSLNPTMTAMATVSEAFRVVQRLSREKALAAAHEALSDVGLSGDLLDRVPRGLSGGQLQRVSIARALACRPDVLVADEATASLDVSVQAQIIHLLVDLVDTRGMALVMISHDLHLTRTVADRLVVMRKGRVVEQGGADEIFRSPSTPYTRELLASAFLDAP